MIDIDKKNRKEYEREKARKRMHAQVDPDNYEFIPAVVKDTNPYDNETHQRVAIYVRVSTDDVRQTTSFELQKKYYEDFVRQHPHWTLVKIYADEGKSGTTTEHRKEFLQMIDDAKSGKFDMIITKSVSRFARNLHDFIGVVRKLAHLKRRVGVFFESEAIFSLNEDAQLALSFQATMAEEESHTRSRSMESSLIMRLHHGVPLTPKLLGYTHNAEGKLVINEDEAPTVKLVFYMYLYGYSTKQIADALNSLQRKSYLGNIKWTANGIIQILRNERHCGDVLTRKTWTPDYHDHKSVKNRGDKAQSRYFNHHDAIISRDDFIAVQHMLDNARYRNKAFLPEIRVIKEGKLKGFVSINPRWAGFKYKDYINASQSVYITETDGKDTLSPPSQDENLRIEFSAGDFDMRGFEVTRSEFFDTPRKPSVSFGNKKIKFSSEIVRKFGAKNYIELLINPIEKKFAIRGTDTNNRHGVYCSKLSMKKYIPKDISSAAFNDTLFELFSWNTDCRYKIVGSIYEKDNELVYIFDAQNSEAFLNPHMLERAIPEEQAEQSKPLTTFGKRIRAIPQEWTSSFGKDYYSHELTLEALDSQNEQDWHLRLQGQLYETGKRINVTGFDVLKNYIHNELSGVALQE